MPGNTKLLGLEPGGFIRLERWGKQTKVKVGSEACYFIEEACRTDLPLRPPMEKSLPTTAAFDTRSDTIEFSLDAIDAEHVRMHLSVGDKVWKNETDRRLAGILEEALKDRSEFYELAEEPGIAHEP